MEAHKSRWFRFPVFTAVGFAAAAGLAALFQPHYLTLCNTMNRESGAQCTPVSMQSMIGIFVIALGVFTLVVVPIVSAFFHLLRHGHSWETPRGTETALTNLPILAGVIYLAAGTLVAVGGY